MSYAIRAATGEDRTSIIELLREYLPDLDPERRYRWLYTDNPHGAAHTWLACRESSGEVIGMTSFFMRKLWVDGQVVSAALGGDGYVRKTERGQGLGTRMHEASREQLANLGIDIMFGTPSAMNRGPLARSGTTNVDRVCRYTRPLSFRALPVPQPPGGSWLLDRLILPRDRGARLDSMSSLDRRVNGVWRDFVQELGGRGVTTVRDAAFYTWRFLDTPRGLQIPYVIVKDGGTVGCCALQPSGDHVLVIDLMCTQKNFSTCVSAIARSAGGAKCIDLRFTEHGAWSPWLKWRGFVKVESDKVLNVMLPVRSELRHKLLDPSRWFFTWIECDQDYLD